MFDVPVITSEDPNDCGPTCLQMLLKYYGVDVDLKTLSEECQLGIFGCKMSDMGNAARLHGLEPTYWKVGDGDMIGVDRPAIVHWKYTHYCIYCGEDENGKVVIINPDRGRYRMEPDSFDALFTDYALFNGKPVWPDDKENASEADPETTE